MAGDTPLNSPVDSPVSRSFSPFDFLSRVGSGTAAATATAGVPSTLVATRTIKICLIGDVGAGKTALFNRLTSSSFVPVSSHSCPNKL